MTEVKFEFFAKKKDDPSEPKPLRIHKGELYHKPNEFGIAVETCNQDVSIELVITPKGFSLFDDYKTVELIPEQKNNKDDLLWLWCYDANFMPADFSKMSKQLQGEIIMELLNRNSLKSVLIEIIIDGMVIAKNGHPVKPYKYKEVANGTNS